MDAIAVLLIGVGLYLVYEAVKNPQPAPIAKALSTAQAAQTPGG